jgi:hypothetical protein
MSVEGRLRVVACERGRVAAARSAAPATNGVLALSGAITGALAVIGPPGHPRGAVAVFNSDE